MPMVKFIKNFRIDFSRPMYTKISDIEITF